MQWHTDIPQELFDQVGQVILLEAKPGRPRHDLLQRWLYTAQEQHAMTWLLSCDRAADGPWAGLKDLLDDLIPHLWVDAPELITRHDYELAMILPALRRKISVRNPTLTDQSTQSERTRNWPADRAYRIVHGLIDLLEEWHQRSACSSYIIACDYFDRSGALVRRFFRELIRRRGQQLRLTVLIAVDPGAGQEIADQFDERYPVRGIRLDLPSDPIIPIEREEMTRLAQELTQQVGEDAIELEIHLPELIRYWSFSDQPEKALTYQIGAFSIYNTRGFYEDALVYGEAALDQLERYHPDDMTRILTVYIKLYSSYLGLKRPFEALHISEKAIAMAKKPKDVVPWCYSIAMLYARFLPERDFARAEAYLEQGLEELARSDQPHHTKLFQAAFNRNGLALIRHFQGRPEEAIAICKSCFDQLNEHLAPGEHRLHRSVLLYNIAQVYASTGPYDDAVAYFTSAMAMDPNYSEYYNERGNVLLNMERLDDALNDYLKAVELSPPYAEVWTNLGQCYRLMGRMTEAIDAYSHALDIDPHQALSMVGRAEAFEALGQLDAAMADYNAALDLDPNRPLTLASRAILYYEAGRLQEALADLDRAIALSPETPDLYQNRAIALSDLQRFDEAANDLQTYLQLCPDAADCVEVEHKLSELLVLQLELSDK
jgi:tetratricopeptide (TPR) repeat protein